jgi:beta-glucosidase
VQISGSFINGADVAVHDVTVTPGVPVGWSVSPRSITLTQVAAHTTKDLTFTVTPPATTSPGSQQLTLDANFNEQAVGRAKVTQAAQTVTTPYTSWASAYNNTGISDDSDPTAANFDGSGYSFSAEQLAAVGITPGGTVTAGTASFTWPGVQPGQPDNIAASGQVIAMTGSGTTLNLLGAGGPGTQSGDITVTYTDGTTSTSQITLADWWVNSPAAGDTLVATCANWNEAPTGTGPHQVSLYATALPLTAGKTIAYVSLPNIPGMHLFAASVD